jgi:hypothetical protein
MVDQCSQDATNNVVELARGGLRINVATEKLRNDGRSGSMDTLSDRLGGKFINFGRLAFKWDSPCTHPQSPRV